MSASFEILLSSSAKKIAFGRDEESGKLMCMYDNICNIVKNNRIYLITDIHSLLRVYFIMFLAWLSFFHIISGPLLVWCLCSCSAY